MAISFSCPRCGASSASLDDIREGYCGNCRAWTGGPLPPGVMLLTPAMLLWDPRWKYEYTGAGRPPAATFSWNPQASPDVMEWRPGVQLGSFTVTWSRTEAGGRCILTVPTEPLCREILERMGPGPAARDWSWDELRRLAGVINQAVEDFGSAQIPAARPGVWECPACGTMFEVPAGHHGPVLCGRHSPPEQMRLAAPYVATADQIASGPLTWDRPESDPLGDLQQARGLIERYAEAHPDPDRTVADVLGALSGAGLCVTAEISGQLTPEQYEAVQAAMAHWDRARELADARAARRPPRTSRERRLRTTRQVLDDAEALIARLDGEGYTVADKARRIEAAEGTMPPDYLDTGAMSWRRGDPAL